MSTGRKILPPPFHWNTFRHLCLSTNSPQFENFRKTLKNLLKKNQRSFEKSAEFIKTYRNLPKLHRILLNCGKKKNMHISYIPSNSVINWNRMYESNWDLKKKKKREFHRKKSEVTQILYVHQNWNLIPEPTHYA